MKITVIYGSNDSINAHQLNDFYKVMEVDTLCTTPSLTESSLSLLIKAADESETSHVVVLTNDRTLSLIRMYLLQRKFPGLSFRSASRLQFELQLIDYEAAWSKRGQVFPIGLRGSGKAWHAAAVYLAAMEMGEDSNVIPFAVAPLAFMGNRSRYTVGLHPETIDKMIFEHQKRAAKQVAMARVIAWDEASGPDYSTVTIPMNVNYASLVDPLRLSDDQLRVAYGSGFVVDPAVKLTKAAMVERLRQHLDGKVPAALRIQDVDGA